MHLYVTINKRMRFADGFYRVIPRLQSNTGKDSVGCVAAVQTVIGQVFFFGPLGIFFFALHSDSFFDPQTAIAKLILPAHADKCFLFLGWPN